ncbi:elongation factor P, partial [Mycoplasmopsis synoviae]
SDYRQIENDLSKVEWKMNFLKENLEVQVRMFQDDILDIELSTNVDLKVTYAPDAVKANTTTNRQKKVILETNFELETPMFIKENDVIIVSTE